MEYIATIHLESSESMRINGKESFLGHMWVEYLDVKTGKIEKFGFELDESKSLNLTKEEKEKIEIFMDIIKHDTLKDDDFKHLAKLPLKELQIFHEEFLLIEQERERILKKHKELGVVGISNVLKMNLEQLKQFEKVTEQFSLYDPIALDLNANGKIDTLSLENGVFFDHNGDEIAFKSSWISAEDGIKCGI